MSIFIRKQNLRYRYDKWGGLAWYPRSYIYKISGIQTGILELLEYPVNISDLILLFPNCKPCSKKNKRKPKTGRKTILGSYSTIYLL